jgi:hypothetical protein
MTYPLPLEFNERFCFPLQHLILQYIGNPIKLIIDHKNNQLCNIIKSKYAQYEEILFKNQHLYWSYFAQIKNSNDYFQVKTIKATNFNEYFWKVPNYDPWLNILNNSDREHHVFIIEIKRIIDTSSNSYRIIKLRIAFDKYNIYYKEDLGYISVTFSN